MRPESLIPFLAILLPLIFVYSSASIYRSIYPEEHVREALSTIAEYRRLSAESQRSKRKLKKLKAMEPQYRKARSLLLRSTLLKTVLLMVGYVAGSLLVTEVIPGLVSPYYVPGIVIISEGGVCVVPSLIVYFLAFILFYVALRDNFL